MSYRIQECCTYNHASMFHVIIQYVSVEYTYMYLRILCVLYMYSIHIIIMDQFSIPKLCE